MLIALVTGNVPYMPCSEVTSCASLAATDTSPASSAQSLICVVVIHFRMNTLNPHLRDLSTAGGRIHAFKAIADHVYGPWREKGWHPAPYKEHRHIGMSVSSEK